MATISVVVAGAKRAQKKLAAVVRKMRGKPLIRVYHPFTLSECFFIGTTMNDLIEEIELPQRARAAVGTCIEINEATGDIAENMCEACLEPSRGVFDAVHEMLVAIIYAVLNKNEASVLVKVSADADGSPVITVHPDDKITH